jgi:hypothetical protein
MIKRIAKYLKVLALIVTAFIINSGFVDTHIAYPLTKDNSMSVIKILGCDTMPQVKFWQRIMNLHQDSCIINIHHNRTVLATVHTSVWDNIERSKKLHIADSLRKIYAINDTSKVVGTLGKSFFYLFEKVADKVPLGMQAFEDNEVDGWYAKSILLIESPNQLQKSNVGAYGAFQLMPGVARAYGLKVNKKTDERANFNRSAYAASMLLKTICIPKTKQLLDTLHIPYTEDELWFKLLVMHTYHAGIGNVKAALYAMPAGLQGMPLIYKLWNTNARGFQGASQNYSQLILAAYLEYDRRVDKVKKK